MALCASPLLVLAIGWGAARLSLPKTRGRLALAGLSAAVAVERDQRGVPTITGATRLDVARATGFVHAQERFFQMDLLRRRAAGELSELLGRATLKLDRTARVHRFRFRAQRAMVDAPAEDQALLTAYTEGVNAGLAALRVRPVEYLLLRTRPRRWMPEDSVLVIAAMYLQLQDSSGARESLLATAYEAWPRAIADFLTTPGSDWDTPLVGERIDARAVPGPEVIDLRRTRGLRQPAAAHGAVASSDVPEPLATPDGGLVGSNSWALAGWRTADGRALLANDMHLGHSVPNVWYQARLVWTPPGSAAPSHATGVTLPGLPTVVAGSNGDIAWGFTNATGDWSDLVILEPDRQSAARYLAPHGPRRFASVDERIHVRGAGDVVLNVLETVWGPVVDRDRRGRRRALAWVAHHPEGLSLGLAALESAHSVVEALDAGSRLGLPAQNLVVADRQGHIGWSVAGRIPRRAGFDGRLPTSWADGQRRWDGWLTTAEYPRVVDPPDGIIVTANNRLVGGASLVLIGDGGYDEGARARQIRDALLPLVRARPRDMLRIQLDDRALFLERWRDLARGVLDDAAAEKSPARRAFRHLLETQWSGRASVDSAAYLLARRFRSEVAARALRPLLEPLHALDSLAPTTLSSPPEGPLWRLVSERPRHLLPPGYARWADLLLEAIDETAAELTREYGSLDASTWGAFNTVRIQHPLGRAQPLLAWWLDMRPRPLPGDAHMPRVQGRHGGASERFAVAPGAEAQGYFHMPCGQSGHPLSAHYSDMQEAWASGDALPFLPSPGRERLVLTP